MFTFLRALFLKDEKKKKEITTLTKVFSTSLEEVVQREQLLINDDNDDYKIPLIVNECIQVLEENANKEGIFRVPGSQEEIDSIVKKVDSGKHVNLRQYPVNTIASVLKKYVRELPEPLLTYEKYDEWIKLSSLNNEEKERALVSNLFFDLPTVNQSLFIKLLALLHRISTRPNVQTSKMTDSNLAFIWGMNILRSKNSDLIVGDIGKVGIVMKICIREYENLQDLYDEIVKQQKDEKTAIM
ncbi:hypothetical protein ABK040_005254 [Willaertia magna]